MHESPTIPADATQPSWSEQLHALYMLGMMTVIASILTTAMIFQYGYGELPCPLCLLQRVAMLGVCFAIMQNFRNGFSYRNSGLGMIFALLLLIVSVRQTLLDIYPRPGHSYIGSAVLGLHMPVWSVLIALALLIAYAIELMAFGGSGPRNTAIKNQRLISTAAAAVSLYVIGIGIINFVSVVLQCGVGECHTFGYALLK
jgi:disulfide bond formation protein DsbB